MAHDAHSDFESSIGDLDERTTGDLCQSQLLPELLNRIRELFGAPVSSKDPDGQNDLPQPWTQLDHTCRTERCAEDP